MKWLMIFTIFISLNSFAQNAAEALRIVNPKSSLYEVLNISPKATPEEIKGAYRRLMSAYHPDRHQNNPANLKAATQVMTKLNAARETLLDPLKRKSYDITVRATSTVKTAAGKSAPDVQKWNFTDFGKEKVKPKPQPEKTKAPPKPEPEVKAQKTEVRIETPSSSAPSTSSTSYTSKQAQKVYGETSRCGVGYFKTFVDLML